jgi:hypothetical protein
MHLRQAKCWHTTCIITGVRIAASSTTTSTAVMPTPVSAIPSGVTFQAALATSSDRVNADSTMGAGSKTHSGNSAARRSAGNPEKAQLLSNDTAPATVPVPPVDQKADPAKDSLGGQSDARTVDGSSKTTAETPDLRAAGTSPDPTPQTPAVQPKADASDTATTGQQPLRIAAPPDKAADVAAEAKSLAAPVAFDSTAPSDAAAQTGTAIAAQSVGETSKLQMSSTAATLPSKGDSIQPAGKATQKTADAAGTKNTNTSIATDTPKTKAADAAGTTGDGSSHNAQSNGQPAQHSQADASQPVVAMPKIVDNVAAQAQPVPTSAASHEVATTVGSLHDGTHQTLDHGVMSSSAQDGDEVTPATGINAAKLVQTMSETEMRVGLHSNEFGSISIRTSVSQQQMLAQISLDHSDLSKAISAHVASVQTKLGNDYGLNTVIQVNHQAASTAGQGSSQQREQRSFAPSVPAENTAVSADPDFGISPAALAGTSNGYRLDIRA